MMKGILVIIMGLFIASCSDSYEKEEFKAIEDFANDFLSNNHLKYILEPPTPYDEELHFKPNRDSLDLKVYLSDALLPISQVKEDNEWMFRDNYLGTEDSSLFHGILNSKRFIQLKYREFDKRKIELMKPYRQFEKSPEKIESDEEYTLLNFSRICFDDKRENGIIVVEFRKGFNHGTMNGYHMALLIKKIDKKWTYIPRK